ncbi:hypothetical protein K503DRAFT_870586 [Rhizopogon vinicolor AM-OR11-026]|uniref:DUF6534 domain-containing protein n=1 Tax=Rhizopogon vinicolor AM-OR11-026 TaxID=1314800 RepID=A0A1B7MG42_9AGAM|nr:hypothetical protein K503DRAFT_870586 [Rhizopogon vinicolor AM-OR11-026]
MSSSPVACAPVTSNLDTSYGAILGGVCLGFMFYGANCLQIFVYLVNYPKDRIALKVMVAALWASDTAHQILGTIGIWQYLITNYGNYVFLEETHVPLLLALVFSAIVSTIAQLFLTHKIWQLSGGTWIFPAFLVPAALSQLALTCYYVYRAVTDLTVTNLSNLDSYATAVNALAAGTDIIIAVVMCALLARQRTGFSKRTDAMLVRLIILSVNSGLWTGVFALISAVMAGVAVQNDLQYAWLQFCMSPLYCNTILGCLNARDFINNGVHKNRGPAFNLPISNSREGDSQRPVPLNVAVETKQATDTDSLEDQTLQASSRGKQSLGF